jgi:hypothetical protein
MEHTRQTQLRLEIEGLRRTLWRDDESGGVDPIFTFISARAQIFGAPASNSDKHEGYEGWVARGRPRWKARPTFQSPAGAEGFPRI